MFQAVVRAASGVGQERPVGDWASRNKSRRWSSLIGLQAPVGRGRGDGAGTSGFSRRTVARFVCSGAECGSRGAPLREVNRGRDGSILGRRRPCSGSTVGRASPCHNGRFADRLCRIRAHGEGDVLTPLYRLSRARHHVRPPYCSLGRDCPLNWERCCEERILHLRRSDLHRLV